MSTHFKQLLLILIVCGFASNSFAAWARNTHYTACKGNTCHHATYKKQCYHGNCRVVRHSSTWHR